MAILTESFLLNALLAGIFSSTVLAFLGVLVVWRRIVFVGIALCQVAALGAVLGLAVGVNPNIFSAILCAAAVLVLGRNSDDKIFSREATIGAVYVLATALLFLVVAKSPLLESSGIDLIEGNLLYVRDADVVLILAISCLILLVNVLFLKRILAASFDPETSRVLGVSVQRWNFLFFFSLGLAMAVFVRNSGVIFLFGCLLLPPLAAMGLVKSVKSVLWVSPLLAVVAVVLGLECSFRYDLPATPLMVINMGIILGVAWIVNRYKNNIL